MADPELENILEEAQIFLDGGKLEDARQTLAEAVSRWPTDPKLMALIMKVREARLAAGGIRPSAAEMAPRPIPAAATDGTSRSLYLYSGLAAAAVMSLFIFCGRNEAPAVHAAFEAYQSAMQTRDLRALKACLTRDKAFAIDESGDGQGMTAELVFALNPEDVRISETKVEGDRATLSLEGRFQEVMTGGTVVLLKEDSTWKVDQVKWRVSFDGESYTATDVEESTEFMTQSGEAQERAEDAVSDTAEAVDVAEGKHAFFPDGTAKLSEDALYEILASSNFPGDAYRELEKRGKKSAALEALQARLRDRRPNWREPGSTVVQILSEAGQSILFDWDRELSPSREDENIELLEWEIEVRGTSLYTSGKLHLGRGIVEGYSRKPENNALDLTPGSEIEFTLSRENQDLSHKELVIEANPGDNIWTDVLLADNLEPGKYSVRPFLHAQFTGSDGIPKSLNFNNQGLRVEIR